MPTVINGTTGVSKVQDDVIEQPDLKTGVAGTGPAFSAYLSSNQAAPSVGTWTKVSLNTEHFDTNGNFASNRFTPTVAGYYQLHGIVLFDTGSNALCAIAIYKNGGESQRGVTTTASLTYGINVSSLVYLNGSTDYIELYVYVSNSTALTGGASNTFLSGCLVRSAT